MTETEKKHTMIANTAGIHISKEAVQGIEE